MLEFEDVDDPALGYIVATDAQVRAAIDFGREHAAGSLLIHCFHGRGRSPAIALAILADRAGIGAEAQAVARMFEIAPSARPNLVVVSHADHLLHRGGALADALLAWERERPSFAANRLARRELALRNPHLYARAPSADEA